MFHTLFLALGYAATYEMYMRHSLGPNEGEICGCEPTKLHSMCDFVNCIKDSDATCTDWHQVTDSVEYQITQAALANHLLSLPLLHSKNTSISEAYLPIDNDVDCASGIVYMDYEPITQEYDWIIQKIGDSNLAHIVFSDWQIGDSEGQTIRFACNQGSFIIDPHAWPKIVYSYVRQERD